MSRSRTTTKPVPNLTNKEYHMLHALTFGPVGNMQPQLEKERQLGTGYAVIHRIDKIVAGWSLVFDDVDLEWSDYPYTMAYFYTHEDYRRMGVGDRLMQHVRRIAPVPMVDPWDYASFTFFKQMMPVLVSEDNPYYNAFKELTKV